MNYSFLIAGHTKFGPDRCFGLIKRANRVKFVSSLYEFADMVDSSSTVGINKSQLVGTHGGRVIVPVFNWSSYLERYFIKVPNIKYTITSDFPKTSQESFISKNSVILQNNP